MTNIYILFYWNFLCDFLGSLEIFMKFTPMAEEFDKAFRKDGDPYVGTM